MHILTVDHVSLNFGSLKALNNVSFTVDNEILGLIGPNGSGKTTLINCITGIYKPKGTISLGDKEITNLSPHQIFRNGIARTFQIPRPFVRMTVRENIMVATNDQNSVDEILSMVDLKDKANSLAGKLTFPELRKLEIGRALAGKPQLLMLDEAISGLNLTESAMMVELIKDLHKKTGVAILWIEHVMQAVMENANRIIVFNQGEKMVEGLPAEVAQNPEVVEVYLGIKYEFKE